MIKIIKIMIICITISVLWLSCADVLFSISASWNGEETVRG